MSPINNTIRKKLLIRGRVVLLLILLMIITSQIVVEVLKETADEFHIEYLEITAIQNLKLSFYQLLFQSNKHTLIENSDDQAFFEILIFQAHERLADCRKELTASHSIDILHNLDHSLEKVDSLSSSLFKLEQIDEGSRHEDILKMMNDEINEGLIQVDIILIETNTEIENYVEQSKTVFQHSTLTILLLGITIILIIVIGGVKFINNLTKPIHNLVTTTKRIISGDRGVKVRIDTGDEFSILANSFNLMLDSLENSTVTKAYFDNIIKNMFDSLIVTDNRLRIRSVNQSSSSLLGYSKSWFTGKHIGVLFGDNSNDRKESLNGKELVDEKKKINSMNFLTHSSGKQIPALISCTILKSDIGVSEGLIIVGHDLTKKVEIEKKLEQSRKQSQIDINEAQEEERMRIATDLHDGLGQLLTSISYSTQEFQNLDLSNADAKEKLISKMQEQIDQAILESKNLAHNLIPIVLKDFGLIVAINNLVDRANELYDIQITFNAFDYNERIDAKLEKSLYRICQESLNNIVKHSKAKSVHIQIFKQEELLVLVIDDDGIGFDVKSLSEKSRHGIGLISMRERVQAFEGTLSIDSQPGKGTEIIIEIPIEINRKDGNS